MGANATGSDPTDACLGLTTFAEQITCTAYAADIFVWPALVFVIVAMLFLWLARVTYHVKTFLLLKCKPASVKGDDDPYPFCGGFTKQLSVADNKAFAVSFSGYILATGLILWSSLANMKVAKTPELDVQTQAENIGNVVMWQFIGILLLEIARILNDNLLLRGMDNCVEVVVKQNVAVACAEFGTYTATGLVVMAATSGVDTKIEFDISTALIWFICGQLVFIAFATLSGSNAISGFNAAAEIKNRNVAAGTLWALQTISLGAIISNAVLKSDSIVTFFVWSLLGTLLLLLVRIFVDKLIIPAQRLSKEVKEDKNLGAAILVGGISLGFAVFLNTFLPDRCNLVQV